MKEDKGASSGMDLFWQEKYEWGRERKHSRFSLLLSFELLCRYFFGHIHTWKTVSSFFRSPYPFCCTPNIAFCVSMSGGRRRISRRLIRLFLFFLSSMAVSRREGKRIVSKTNNHCSNIVRFALGKRLILFVLIVREQKQTNCFGIKYVDQFINCTLKMLT